MLGVVLAVLLLSTAATVAAEGHPVSRSTDGARLYRGQCAPCHGRSGGGDGADASSFAPPPTDLRATFRAGHDTAALVARVLDGRRLALTLDREALRRRVDDVEAVVAHLERLSRTDWSVAGRGEELWIERCETCHGQFARALPTSADDLRRGVRHRRAGLPVIPPLASEADEKALLAFVGLLGPGVETYERYCASCHGEDGRGAGSDVSTTGLEPPGVIFDRSYFAAHDGDYLRTKAWRIFVDD
jgi:mono/diheme cytochrome c family protein